MKDIRTNLNNTIDLKLINAVEYAEFKGLIVVKNLSYLQKILMKSKKITNIVFISSVMYLIMGIVGIYQTHAYNDSSELKYYNVDNYRDLERLKRIEACERVYISNKEFVDNTFIHKSQDSVIRCATMMGLIGAYESGFYTSNRYTRDNNAFGIKNKYGYFKKYKNTYEGKLDFAEKYLVGHGNNYFRGHKNRTISQFVENWSGDAREVELRYIKFVSDRYWNMYKTLYFMYYMKSE